jgi:plastocyanin
MLIIMKNINGSKSRFLLVSFFQFGIIILAGSCNKSSYNSMTGITGGTGGTGGSGNPGTNQVFIENMSFTPSSLMISSSTTVTWTNKDTIVHTVTSDTGLFDSGNILPNGSYSYTFTTSGTYSYHCKIHTGMTASVSVDIPAAPPTTPGY